MSITRRITLLLLSVFAVYMAVTFTVIREGMLPAFGQLDRDLAALNQDRVDEYIRTQRDNIATYVRDFALWTEMQQYMFDRDPEFAKTTLTYDLGAVLDTSVFILLDTNQDPVFTNIYGVEGGDEVSIDDFFPSPIHELKDTFKFSGIDDAIASGVVMGKAHPFLFSAYPVLNNDDQGPVAGSLIVGRPLDATFVADMRERLALDVSVLSAAEAPPAADVSAGVESVEDVVIVESDNNLHQYKQVDDIFGNPTFHFEVITDREVLYFGEETIDSVFTILAVMLLVFTLPLWLILDRNIISKIRQLSQHIGSMQRDGDLNKQIDFAKNDEIGDVAMAFNALSTSLARSQEESEAAREAALKLAEVKSQFLANMSHEIRTPMNGLMGLIFLLKETKMDRMQKEYLQLAGNAGESLMQILNDILDVSKIDANKMELECMEMNLHQLVDEILELLSGSHTAEGLGLGSMIEADVPQYIKGDPTRIRQILTNLVSNALKFTPTGNVCVRVEKLPDCQLRIAVTDTGIGIDADAQQRIFENFTQAEGSTTREYGGTGLGLSLCKRLVELMGGDIGVESLAGEGSTFWFTIQYTPSSAGDIFLTPHHSLQTLGTLLVSDDDCTTKITRHYFNQWQVPDRTLPGIAELQVLQSREGEFQRVLVDCPDLLEACAAIDIVQKTFPGSVRAIALTSREQFANQQTLLQAGYDEVVLKPLNAAKLMSALMAEDDSEADTVMPFVGQAKENEVQRRHVLLVEDNVVNQKVAAGMLKKLGCTVDIAENGEIACEHVAKQRYDLVFMDCQMPVMSGLDATRHIRERERELGVEAQAIVAMTAHALDEHQEHSLEAGMNGHISKPINITELAKVLNNWSR